MKKSARDWKLKKSYKEGDEYINNYLDTISDEEISKKGLEDKLKRRRLEVVTKSTTKELIQYIKERLEKDIEFSNYSNPTKVKITKELIEDIIISQFKMLKQVIIDGKGESLRLKYLGVFGLKGGRYTYFLKQQEELAKLNKVNETKEEDK